MDKLTFEQEVTWDTVTPEINKAFIVYAEKELGKKITEYDIEDYKVTIKIEVSLY